MTAVILRFPRRRRAREVATGHYFIDLFGQCVGQIDEYPSRFVAYAFTDGRRPSGRPSYQRFVVPTVEEGQRRIIEVRLRLISPGLPEMLESEAR